ncbi:hypothetical protein ACFV42_49525, partial [Streptomyces solisilvae]|uniref:hypothetical protein n=2 Tax=Streptomyces TaxID=1883 RepID=UPI0036D19215
DVSGKWLPLQDYTQQVRQAAGYGAEHPINKRTGELENFLTDSGWDIIAAGGFSQLTFPGNMPTGKEATKLMTAQIGTQHPSTPARPVLGMNEVDLAYVLAALSTYVTHGTTVSVA